MSLAPPAGTSPPLAVSKSPRTPTGLGAVREGHDIMIETGTGRTRHNITAPDFIAVSF
jgi:hypothetical protein